MWPRRTALSLTFIAAAAVAGAALPLSAQFRPSPRAHGPTETITIRTTEGTALAFDLTPDGRTIIFDLLGQLWSLPAEGGKAIALTDAVRDTADDSDPSVSPDGAWIVFRSDRPQGRGLWLRSLIDGKLRQLTDSTYFVNNEHVAPSWSPDSRRIAYLARWQLRVRNMVTNEELEFHPPGLPRFLTHLTWSPDGARILVVAGFNPGRPWVVDVAANRAAPLDSITRDMRSPRYSSDGSRIAYFSERDSSRITELRVRTTVNATERLIAEGRDLTALRVRWSPDGRWLYYSADGKVWRVSSEGGAPIQIPFTATLTFTRTRYQRRTVSLPLPGKTISARGFSGLALAPDARRYAIIALGKLWIAKVGRTPRAISTMPSTAYGLSWSPDGRRLTWSAGRGGTEDLFVTDVNSGDTRQLTALPGTESLASWSPNGRLIAFVHWAKPESSSLPWSADAVGLRIRVIEANRSAPATLSDTRDLGSFSAAGLGYQTLMLPTDNRLNWNATSSSVLSFTNQSWPVANGDSAKAVWLGLDGRKEELHVFPYRPSFAYVGHDGSLTYVQDGLLWRMSPNGETQLLSRGAALYPSVADDGTVLFVSDHGLRIRPPTGTEVDLGWPIVLRVAPAPPPLLIRNARIFDGSGAAPAGTHDILIESGRIAGITATGRIPTRRDVAELDASGRTVIPGLIDVHTHLRDPAMLPAALYFGVTTVRDMGSPLALAAAQRDAVLAGVAQGARAIVSGLMFYPAPTTGGLTTDQDWMPRDSATMERGVSLLRSFGAEHVKMLFPLTFPSGAMLVRISRANGFTISGHCANAVSLVAAGISGQEHLNGQCDSRSTAIGHDDRVQLYRAGGLYGTSTSFLDRAHTRASRDTAAAHDAELMPFITPRLRLMRFSDDPGDERLALVRDAQGDDARVGALRFHQARLPLVLGTDAPGFPDGLHGEIAEVVTAGLTPSEALVAATSTAAGVLGIDGDVGTIAVGKIADLVLLDADPLIDIRNTRRIWRVIQGGRVVDRDALRSVAIQGK